MGERSTTRLGLSALTRRSYHGSRQVRVGRGRKQTVPTTFSYSTGGVGGASNRRRERAGQDRYFHVSGRHLSDGKFVLFGLHKPSRRRVALDIVAKAKSPDRMWYCPSRTRTILELPNWVGTAMVMRTSPRNAAYESEASRKVGVATRQLLAAESRRKNSYHALGMKRIDRAACSVWTQIGEPAPFNSRAEPLLPFERNSGIVWFLFPGNNDLRFPTIMFVTSISASWI